MNTVIFSLIRAFRGYSYETVGMISGFFNDPEQAQACANRIRSVADTQVEVCGSHISVSL